MRAGRQLRSIAWGLLFAALGAGSADAQGGMCGPANEPVLVVLVESPPQVRAAADDISRARPLVNEADTVIFADGRAVTSNLAAVSAHLNALGWASRKIEIVGAGSMPRAPIASASSGRGGRRRG
jgi:hypothetical protein